MKKQILKIALIAISLGFVMQACKKQLNQTPKYGLNNEAVYSDPDNYIHVLAKIYSGLSLTGLNGPAGNGDISGIDEGFSSYVRVLFNLQEVPTDEAVCGWNDPGIPELNKMTWSAENSFVKGMYYRIYYQLTICNEFLREASAEKVEERGFSEADKNKIAMYREEVRFLRALTYSHAIDLFGNVPFITEENKVGSGLPEKIARKDLFDYVESELLDIENRITVTPEYGRAGKAAVQMLLAKMYLNAEVYTGTQRYAECATYADKVITSGSYQLAPSYQDNFLADNHTSPEIIFPVVYDGLFAKTYGGTTFMVNASMGGTMVPANFGVTGKWAGLRTTAPIVDLYTDSMLDGRFLFHRTGQQKDITVLSTFTHGYGVTKYMNKKKDGTNGSNNSVTEYVDIDFPMFRLADAHLMYAEAVLRSGGNTALALTRVNALRERAYGNSTFNYTSLTLQDILDERAKELFWECTRRTDLIRYGLFTGSTYVWPFKGGVAAGTGVSDYLNLYPLPTSDLVLNPNLTQNPGY